MDVSHLIYMKW